MADKDGKRQKDAAKRSPSADEAPSAPPATTGGVGGGAHGIASGHNPGGTLPCGGPGTGLGSVGTGGASRGDTGAGRPCRPDVPPDWAAAVERIAAGGVRRVLVLGPGDAGKSTFCRVLLRQAARSGREVALLDADPAQKLVGPPACVTLGRGEPPRLSALAFVGALDPLRGWRRLVAGTGRMAAQAAGADLLVANTGGLLAGAGRRLKAAKIAAARPDILVAIGEDADLDRVLADHAAVPALRLVRSPLARRKSAGERRALRRGAFRCYFTEAPVWTLGLRGLRLDGEPGGDAMPGPHRLLALADAAGRDLAIGIALGGEAPPSGVMLRAPRPALPVACLRWGALRLDEGAAERSGAWERQAPPRSRPPRL